MKRLSALEYLKLNKFQAFLYNLKLFFCAIPLWFCKLGRGILNFFKNCGLAIAGEFKDIGYTFAKGNWAVKLSFFIFGFRSLSMVPVTADASLTRNSTASTRLSQR